MIEATEICVGDQLVNPAKEHAVRNTRSLRRYPIRSVVQVTDDNIVLDNGVSVPKYNDRSIPITYRLVQGSQPELVTQKMENTGTNKIPCLLVVERYDRTGAAEGNNYLSFADLESATIFARRLAAEYYAGMPDSLPETGGFSTEKVKGEVWLDEGELIIEWTEQPLQQGGSYGDTHYIKVQTLQQYQPDTRLDFWNELIGRH